MISGSDENNIDKDQINIIYELLSPRATSLELEVSRSIRILRNRIENLKGDSKKAAQNSVIIADFEKLSDLAISIAMFQSGYTAEKNPVAIIPISDFINKIRLWANELWDHDQVIIKKLSISSFMMHKNYLYTSALRTRLSRARNEILRLHANFKSIEELLTKKEQEIADEKYEITEIPSQLDSPIMTEIVDNYLITKRGKLLQPNVPIGNTEDYLINQLRKITEDLEKCNSDRRIISVFSETEELLQDWSVDRVLSLGAHLELIDAVRKDIDEGEVNSIILKRIDAFCNTLRLFVNNFDVWHLYVKQSLESSIEVQSNMKEMAIKINQISDTLLDKDCVESSIPRKLKNFVTISLREGKNRAAIGITSALRSITNIGISLTSFVENLRGNSDSLINNPNVRRLGRLCCVVLPMLIELSKIITALSWLEPHAESFNKFCKALKESGMVR